MRPALVLLAAMASIATAAASARELAAQVDVYATLTSDYVFRGISQTWGNPALQGGIDIALPNGVFAGLWISRVDIASGAQRRRRDLELDLYVGVSGELRPDWSWTASLVNYHYPNTGVDYDYLELNGGLYFRDSLSAAISYSAEAAGSHEPGGSLATRFAQPLNPAFSIDGGVGHYWLSSDFLKDYVYWDAGLSWQEGSLALDLRYHGSGGSARRNYGAAADDRLVFSISIGF